MSKNSRGKRGKRRKTNGQRAAERMQSRDIMGGDTYQTAKMIEYAMSADDILLKEMPLDERAKNTVRWDRVSEARRERIYREQLKLLERQDDFSIPIQVTEDAESPERARRIAELSFSRKPECHDVRVHAAAQEDPAACCLWWWDQRTHAPLFSANSGSTFARDVLHLDLCQSEIMHKHTTYNRATAVMSRFFDGRTGRIRRTWTGKTWEQMSAFIGKNFGSPVRTYRLDPIARILCVCYPVDHGGRFHVGLMMSVRAPTTHRGNTVSLNTISESIDDVKLLILEDRMALFPIRCPCAIPVSELPETGKSNSEKSL